MTKKLEHRGKTFNYTEEAEQDAKAVWGLDLVTFATGAIDSLVELNTEFYTLEVSVTKSEAGITVTAKPAP
jgi:hypothetical protein